LLLDWQFLADAEELIGSLAAGVAYDLAKFIT
jgi:hypothetical protein